MTTQADRLRQDIERTRSELSDDVNALTRKVSPRRVVGDRVERTRGVFRSAKEKIMGTTAGIGQKAGSATSSMTDQMSSAASSTASTVGSAASAMGHAASAAPQMMRERTEGSPLAVGLIAFGAGVLISSLFPASRREQQLTGQLKDTAAKHSEQFKQEASEIAHTMQENLREPVQQAKESVKSTTTESMTAVRERGRTAAQDVRDQAQQAKENLQR